MSRPSLHGRFVPHIHVLYREVPFILNITACPEGRYRATSATLSKLDFYTYEKPTYSRCRANLTQAVPAHPCARGIPFILNISAS